MTIHATMNPVGSTNPKDLIDNAQNLDYLSVGPLLSYPDRRGVYRLSWAGIEAAFAAAQAARAAEYSAEKLARDTEFSEDQGLRADEFQVAQDLREIQFNKQLDASGFENPALAYVEGAQLQVDRVTQLVVRSGILYSVRRPASFPYILTGTWATDSTHLVVRADQSLRQDLADILDPLNGVARIGVPGTGKYLDEILKTRIFPGIILDTATTSWAGISSVNYTEDKAPELATLAGLKKHVIIDTQIALNAAITLNKDYFRMECSPGGILLNGPGMAQKSMLVTTGNHITFDKMRMDNPAMLKANTGNRQVAIQIKSNYVAVTRSKFWRMLTSVACESQGEWYGTEIVGNKAYECLGTGAGPTDDGTNNYGEDRGDAFVIWGASGKMLNNEAYCMAGQDARIAFHCEGLQILHPQPSGPNDDKDFIMSGNYAGGAFRRHFAFESISRGIISDCVSLGGATWWVIQTSGCKNVIVDSVIAKWDRKTTDQSGKAWSPDRALIGIVNGTDDVQFSNITARWATGADGGDGSIVRASGSNVTYDFGRCRFDNIRAIMNPDIRRTGMDLSILVKPYVSNSRVENALHSFASFDSGSDVTYERCASVNSSANGFRSEGASKIRVKNSLIDGANGGITAGAATYADVQENTFRNITGQEIDLFMLDSPIIVKNNVAEDGGGLLRIRGLDSGTVAATAVRDIEGNVGFSGSLWRYAPATVASAGSKLNTDGKFDGKIVTGTDGNTYISQGITPTAPWAQITAKVTPT